MTRQPWFYCAFISSPYPHRMPLTSSKICFFMMCLLKTLFNCWWLMILSYYGTPGPCNQRLCVMRFQFDIAMSSYYSNCLSQGPPVKLHKHLGQFRLWPQDKVLTQSLARKLSPSLMCSFLAHISCQRTTDTLSGLWQPPDKKYLLLWPTGPPFHFPRSCNARYPS